MSFYVLTLLLKKKSWGRVLVYMKDEFSVCVFSKAWLLQGINTFYTNGRLCLADWCDNTWEGFKVTEAGIT